MTNDDRERVHRIIQGAVNRAGGNWRMAFKQEVDLIEVIVDENVLDAIREMETD